MSNKTIIKRGRILENESEVFTQNAWDNVQWTEEMRQEAEKRIQEQKNGQQEKDETYIEQVELTAGQKWDQFYQIHGNKFFKDRQWIFSEFQELLEYLDEDSPDCRLLEVGCGVGNAVAHILDVNKNPKLQIYCCDISNEAIEVLKRRYNHPSPLKPGAVGHNVTAFQVDVTAENFDDIMPKFVEPSSLDFITLIFAMSAMKPELMRALVRRLKSLLKPSGMIFFRDYAQYDLTQLRFKSKSYLRDNYYLRSDGTTSYFFTQQEVADIFGGEGLKKVELQQDNRMLVNRSKSLKMCRCWIQAKYINPR